MSSHISEQILNTNLFLSPSDLSADIDKTIYNKLKNQLEGLCFEDGYGKGFNNCYNVKNTYESVLKEENLIVLTKEGKIKKTNLVLRESMLKLSD